MKKTTRSTYYRSKPQTLHHLRRRSKTKILVIIALLAVFSYFLFSWFLPTLIGGLAVINRFKTPTKTEKPVAEDATMAPPVLNIPFEATNSALINIKGYSLPLSKVEIYVDEDLKATVDTKNDGSFEANEIALSIGTNNISGKTLDNQNLSSLSSKAIRIIYDNEKPKLDLREPGDNKVIQGGDKKVTIAGTTDNTDDVTVTANGFRLIVKSNGDFSQTIDINEGDNNVVITATDNAGNTTQITRKVTYQP